MLFNNIENTITTAQLSAIELGASSFSHLSFEEFGNLVAQTFGMYLDVLGIDENEDLTLHLSLGLTEDLMSRAIVFTLENVAPYVNEAKANSSLGDEAEAAAVSDVEVV